MTGSAGANFYLEMTRFALIIYQLTIPIASVGLAYLGVKVAIRGWKIVRVLI